MDNVKYNKLLCKTEKIIKGKLISMQINLLNACPSKCLSCRRYEWPNDILPFGKVKELIVRCKQEYDLETIIFSGGDPIMYPQLPEVMDLCDSLGIKFSLITTLITKDKELIKKIAYKAERIHNSMDSASSETYKLIRGVDGFDIARENIELIQRIRNDAHKDPIRFSMTVSKLNYKEAYDVYSFAKKNKCDCNFYYLHTWDDMKLDLKQKEEFKEIIKRIVDEDDKTIGTNAAELLLDTVNVNNSNEGCKRCMVSYIHCAVNADGSIFPCCKLFNENACYEDSIKYACGNIYDGDIIKQLEKRKDGNYPLNVQECKDCMPCYFDVINPFIMKVMEDYDKKVFI